MLEASELLVCRLVEKDVEGDLDTVNVLEIQLIGLLYQKQQPQQNYLWRDHLIQLVMNLNLGQTNTLKQP